MARSLLLAALVLLAVPLALAGRPLPASEPRITPEGYIVSLRDGAGVPAQAAAEALAAAHGLRVKAAWNAVNAFHFT